MAGINFDCDSGRFKKYSYNSKILRNYSNRHVRRHKDEITKGGMYKKIFDYAYGCI